tara:strand:+ start:85 stop:444 length:360 start_codon:yes stop_codon:yes gene_type:complete
MAGPRRRTPQRPQNMGQNRNTAMRNNARAQQNRGTFQGGLSRSQGAAPQNVGQPPAQNRQQCPPGQEPARDPNTGAQTCRPAQANIAGNVPVNDANNVLNPGPASGPGRNIPPRPKRGY